ncbi:helix-turn-helix domain-containing protein [Sulfitobacter sp. 1A13368]|uniref:helix-turn-helix domain-containing protein n=1 Tax=Sulfitobacter sp. 1A13368 TaxID=3368593 RepID=UPI003744CBD5
MNKNRDENRKHQREIHRRAQAGELPLPESIRWIREGFGMTPEYFCRCFGLTLEQLEVLESGAANDALDALRKVAKPFRFHISYAPENRPD